MYLMTYLINFTDFCTCMFILHFTSAHFKQENKRLERCGTLNRPVVQKQVHHSVKHMTDITTCSQEHFCILLYLDFTQLTKLFFFFFNWGCK